MMELPFCRFNQDFLEKLQDPARRDVSRMLMRRQRQQLDSEGGHLLSFLPVQFHFDRGQFEELVRAARALVEIQSKMIGQFLERLGPEAFLELFQVPPAMRRFVNWDELTDPEYLVARFDLVETETGYRFCEFNVDSCVAGAEAQEFAVSYLEEMGLTLDGYQRRSPLADLAEMIGEYARRSDVRRIVILDWSTEGGSAGKGYLSFDRMRQHLVAECGGELPVSVCDEQTFCREWLSPEEAPRTLVHRGFMMEEMDDGGVFLDQLLAAGVRVRNTFESEIRMSKLWFALMHASEFTSGLTDAENGLIRVYLPRTFRMRDWPLSEIRETREQWLFKRNRSFGGIDIRLGQELNEFEFDRFWEKESPDHWVVQEFLATRSGEIPDKCMEDLQRQHLVFGLYLYQDRANGMLVRASPRSRIVNVTAGAAKMAWAFCAEAPNGQSVRVCRSETESVVGKRKHGYDPRIRQD